MVFHRSLSDSKSPQVSRTLLSIPTVFNNAVIWMFSTLPLISKSSSPFNNPSVTVPRAPITICINATFMFHSFFNSFARSMYLSFFSVFSILLYDQPGQCTILRLHFFFFFFVIIIRSCRLAEIR